MLTAGPQHKLLSGPRASDAEGPYANEGLGPTLPVRLEVASGCGRSARCRGTVAGRGERDLDALGCAALLARVTGSFPFGALRLIGDFLGTFFFA